MKNQSVAAVIDAFGDAGALNMRGVPRRTPRYAWTVFAPDSRALAYLADRANMYADLARYKEFSLGDVALAHRR